MPQREAVIRVRAKRKQFKTFEGLLPENPGLNLALTVLHVPYSLDSEIKIGLKAEPGGHNIIID